MKALVLATVCLFAQNSFAQEIIPAPVIMHDPAPAAMLMQQQAAAMQAAQATQAAQVIQPAPVPQNQAVAPAVFYAPASGDKTVIPQAIEVEVPVYQSFQPREKVAKIYTEIKDSQFFLEINPLRLKGSSDDFESNRMTVSNNPELEFEIGSFKAKMMPLDFKFGFENQGWGSFAEVAIEDGSESSELTIYSKIASVKLGAGLSFSASDEEVKIKQDSIVTSKDSMDMIEIIPYFYTAFQLVNDDSLIIEQWNKIGGSYQKAESDGVTIKGVSFIFNPALDVMFKINPKLQIGLGIEAYYERFSGDIESGSNTLDGIGNTFGFELNLIKTKFLF